jgi:hypothetical protein
MSEQNTPPKPEAILVTVNDTVGVSITEDLTARGHGPGSEAVRRVTGDDWRADGDLADGRAVSGTSGRPSHGEDLTVKTVQMLLNHPRWAGWDGDVEKLPPESGADCKVTQTNSGRVLFVEVTRPEPGDYWKALSTSRAATTPQRTIDEMADLLWRRIEGLKGLRENQGIVLAVNALRTPAFAFPQVAAAFRRSHGRDAVGLGFTEVWICGPAEDMVFRLDKPEAEAEGSES